MKVVLPIFVVVLLALFGLVTAGKIETTTDKVDPPPFFPE
uniref:Uncharacterized protein n=1 Tax=Anopheles minimus TaxID=112268 RepID=A0A182VUN8_9DIPT